MLQQTLGLTLIVLLLVGCGGAPDGQQGEIIGVKAQAPLEEVQSGKIKNLEYVGTIEVLLPDDIVVTANCNEELLSVITEATVFNDGQFTFAINDIVFSGPGYVATITIKLEDSQNAMIVRKEADEWEVTEVLK